VRQTAAGYWLLWHSSDMCTGSHWFYLPNQHLGNHLTQRAVSKAAVFAVCPSLQFFVLSRGTATGKYFPHCISYDSCWMTNVLGPTPIELIFASEGSSPFIVSCTIAPQLPTRLETPSLLVETRLLLYYTQNTS
jgi:hypothetical protein